jgi:hypothetical protein
MFKKILASLIVASTAFALSTHAYAGPVKQTAPNQETNWMDRASQNFDGGGY